MVLCRDFLQCWHDLVFGDLTFLSVLIFLELWDFILHRALGSLTLHCYFIAEEPEAER